MLRRHVLLLPLAAGTGSVLAQPTGVPLPAELGGELPAARLRGTATMRWLGLTIYDIELWSPGPVAGEVLDDPLALTLRYARSLKGRAIAERSLDEMRRIGPFSEGQANQWLAAMTRVFPDVGADDRLTGVHLPGRGARFFHNAQWRGEVADAQFARLFFGIWLSPRTSEPALREALLGPGAR
jgi:hypothetical protein